MAWTRQVRTGRLDAVDDLRKLQQGILLHQGVPGLSGARHAKGRSLGACDENAPRHDADAVDHEGQIGVELVLWSAYPTRTLETCPNEEQDA